MSRSRSGGARTGALAFLLATPLAAGPAGAGVALFTCLLPEAAPAICALPAPGAREGTDLLQAQLCPYYGIAQACVTAYGWCALGELLCVGQPCYCPSVYGPVWGQAQ